MPGTPPAASDRLAGTAENENRLTGILKTDESFRAPNSGNLHARLDPELTVVA
jgi:hypothetical protein